MKKLDAKYWSPLRHNRTITSFGDLFPINYDGSIFEFWRRRISGTEHNILDLAAATVR